MTTNVRTRGKGHVPGGLALCLAAALWAGTARADCLTVPFSVSQPAVERFVFRQQTLLADFPDGGEDMENRVALIASSSRAALRPLLAVMKQGNARQREAVAVGLGRAARNCERAGRASSRHIERLVRASGDTALIRDFTAEYRSQPAGPSASPAAPPVQPLPSGTGRLTPGIRPDPGGNAIRPVQPPR